MLTGLHGEAESIPLEIDDLFVVDEHAASSFLVFVIKHDNSRLWIYPGIANSCHCHSLYTIDVSK